ncbi:MAG: spermidine/putrescine ABC transporter substrate-binding protein [Ruminococcaceae bacterium]|nr:spermidine/putrescine ABC transporter substrate-binding protein [Oscillospiraceae bacterium]
MKKTIALLMTCLLCAALLCGCGNSEETLVLNVYNWGEYISDGSEGTLDVNAAFEDYYYETYGKKVKVNYTTYASNEDMYNKLSSGAAVYDIVIPSDYMIAKMIKEDMLLPLNFDNIPNYQYIDEQYKNNYYDPESLYSVPYFCGYVGVIYNTDLVEGTPTDWDALWDEANRGKILQFNNPRDAFGTAQYALGHDVNATEKALWDEALTLLKKQKPLVQSYVMDEVFNKMKNGSAAVAPYYAGDFLTMYEDNPALAFYYPQSGTNIFVDAMCIPTVSRNKELAEAYINFFLTEEIATANAEYTYYASPNTLVRNSESYQATMQEVHEDVISILYGTDDIQATYYQNLDPETTQYMNSLWESLKVESSVGAGVYVVTAVVLALLLVLVLRIIIKKRINSRYY